MSKQYNLLDFSKLSTLVDLLRYRAKQHPDQVAFTFLLDGESEEIHLKYGELEQQAQAIAAQLQLLGMSGERALLLYPPGLEFIAAFCGCLYAGVVAVPAYPPRHNHSLSRLQAVVEDAQAAIALTTTTVLANVEQRCAQSPLQALRWLATDNINNSGQWQEPHLLKQPGRLCRKPCMDQQDLQRLGLLQTVTEVKSVQILWHLERMCVRDPTLHGKLLFCRLKGC